jgi:hypothetical protein
VRLFLPGLFAHMSTCLWLIGFGSCLLSSLLRPDRRDLKGLPLFWTRRPCQARLARRPMNGPPCSRRSHNKETEGGTKERQKEPRRRGRRSYIHRRSRRSYIEGTVGVTGRDRRSHRERRKRVTKKRQKEPQ